MGKKKLSIIFILGLTIGAIFAWVSIFQFKGNAVKEDTELWLSKQQNYDEVRDSLLSKINRHWAFDLYAQHLKLDKTFKAGHYLLKKGMDVIQIVRMLKLGTQTPIRLTFNHAFTPPYLARTLAKQLDADSASFVHALTSKELATELGFDTVTLFSICIPNSYEFYWTTTPEQFVRRMKKEYERFWTKERDKKLSLTGLSRLEALTLASIITQETRQKDEMPRMAGVYMNRLNRGIPLQADPTIKFAMQDFGLRRILYRHLKTQSPYNTYINRGLPPSPICLPSIVAIDAVLNYEKHQYLYFCARPTFDGHHDFARTLREHNANARAYARELNRRKIK